MSSPLIRSAEAEQDITDIVAYLAPRSIKAALRFVDAAEAAMRQLADFPEIGGLADFANPRLADLRVWPIRKFRKYLIFYRVVAGQVQVVRVIHAARDLESVLASI